MCEKRAATVPMILSVSIEMPIKVRHKAVKHQSKSVLQTQITNQQPPSAAIPPRIRIPSTSKRIPGRGCIFPGCFSAAWEISWALDSAFNEVKTTPTQVRKCFWANSEMITSERAEGGLWLLRKSCWFFPLSFLLFIYLFIFFIFTHQFGCFNHPAFFHNRYAASRQIAVCTEMK